MHELSTFSALTIDFSEEGKLDEMIQRSNLRHDFFIFAILKKGSCRIKINLKEFELEKNSLLILPPDSRKESIYISDDAILNGSGIYYHVFDAVATSRKFLGNDRIFLFQKFPCVETDKERSQYSYPAYGRHGKTFGYYGNSYVWHRNPKLSFYGFYTSVGSYVKKIR